VSDYYVLGALVPLTFNVTDADGNPANAGGATLTVVKPDGTTTSPALTNDVVGTYQADYTTTVAGRHIARLVTTGANSGVVEQVFDAAALSLAYVTLTEVKAYLGDTSASDAQITAAMDAERQSQADRCRIQPYTVALREAYMRRVARNLAARAVPVTSFTSFDGGGTSTRVPTTDPEIARLEGPYRKLVIG
jgi:hypothetical protein